MFACFVVALFASRPYSPSAPLAAVRKAHPSFKSFRRQDVYKLFMSLFGTLDEEASYIK